jgi:osmoprotectant transport system ATP-binding protein
VFESVTKRYPDGTVAVNDLSLEMPDNAITVLVGPSGCGKTTSLRMINRMIDPTGGRILIDGTDIKARPAAELRRSIGYVIQHAGLFPHRTVLDNIATVPRLLGWDRRRARDRAVELLDRVGLEPALGRRYPHQLSGGQQQRVGVARALAADPPVMLMDEPFSAVDPIVRKDLQDEFLRIQADLGKTIVFVTHDIDEAIKLGDKIAVMRVGGVLAQYATPAELLSSPQDEFVEDFLGRDRGVRRLSFFASSGLELTMAPVLTAEAPKGGDTDAPFRLVTDDAGRPVGWRAAGDDAAQGELISYGHTFEVGHDSLRAALDSAVLSPTGWAVGVDGDGRVVGVASQETIAAAIRAAHGVTRAIPAEATEVTP